MEYSRSWILQIIYERNQPYHGDKSIGHRCPISLFTNWKGFWWFIMSVNGCINGFLWANVNICKYLYVQSKYVTRNGGRERELLAKWSVIRVVSTQILIESHGSTMKSSKRLIKNSSRFHEIFALEFHYVLIVLLQK